MGEIPTLRKPIQLSPSVRLAKELANTRFERILGNAAQLSLVFVGCVVALVAVQAGQYILAPIFLAIIIGLMCGPIADWMERRGAPSGLSSAAIVLVMIATVAVAIFGFSRPLSEWFARGPQIWEKLRLELANWRGLIDSIGTLQGQLQGVFGSGDAMAVTVEGGGPITDLAFLAPAVLGQVLIFFGGLYFFIAARDPIRISILSLCFTRKMRWRTAHVFRDVELRVSRYLLTITIVNLALGSLVATAMWALGMPSPLLFGALAFVLNYIPFIGQGAMLVLTFLIALGTRDGMAAALVPVAAYEVLSFIESQVVTPNLLGRTMTINPFLIFLSLTFWIWAWGPVGGLVAVPSVLVLHSVITHILPSRSMQSTRTRRDLDRRASADTVEAAPTVTPVTEASTEQSKRAACKAAIATSP